MMYIHEATKEAVKRGKCITKPDMEGFLKIKPTNSSECCKLILKGGRPAPRWNPDADDLMSDNWKVVD